MENKHPDTSVIIMHEGFGGGTVLLALLGGAVVGATVALLTAPRSGAETRARLRHLASCPGTLISRVPEAVSDAAGAFSDALKTDHKQK
jgi:gas vesicle protein